MTSGGLESRSTLQLNEGNSMIFGPNRICGGFSPAPSRLASAVGVEFATSGVPVDGFGLTERAGSADLVTPTDGLESAEEEDPWLLTTNVAMMPMTGMRIPTTHHAHRG